MEFAQLITDKDIFNKLLVLGYRSMNYMPQIDEVDSWTTLIQECNLSNAEGNFLKKKLLRRRRSVPAGGNLYYEIEHFY